MMKKIFSMLLTLSLAFALAVTAFSAPAVTAPAAEKAVSTAAGSYTVQVNGKDSGAAACIMVPLRTVAESLGFTVQWNNGTVLVDDGVMHTEIVIGKDLYTVVTSSDSLVGMSAPFSLGVPSYVADGVTYVPLGLFDALLGSREGAVTISNGTIQIKADRTADSSTEIPSPFQDYETLAAAAQAAGFSLSVPETVSGFQRGGIQVLNNEMIQVFFGSGEDEILIRKAAGSEDISGDYNVYAETGTLTAGQLEITVKGNDGLVHVATWTDGGYSYAVDASAGLSEDALSALIAAVR